MKFGVLNLLVALGTILYCPSVLAGPGKKAVCYLGTWANYRNGDGKFIMENIDPFLCSHLVYSFAKLEKDKITPFDPYLDLIENYGLGGYQRFNGLKKKNPELKTLIAIGGWNEGSEKYSQMAGAPERRKTFVQSCVDFLHKYKFDGLDLDWEYPANRGGVPADKYNFATLLKELKAALEPLGFLLSAAVSAGQSTIDSAYDIPALSKYLDMINLMAYDFHGAWDSSKTGHNAPLYSKDGSGDKLTVDYAVKYWLKNGTPAEKLILGMPLYGRSFTLQSPSNTGLGAPATAAGTPGKITGESGMLGFNEICSMLKSDKGWTEVFDNDIQAPYMYKGNQWVGFDNMESIKLKVDYLQKMKLGGGMVWSIETDDFHGKCKGYKFPLLQTINKGLGRSIRTDPDMDSTEAETISPTPSSSANFITSSNSVTDPDMDSTEAETISSTPSSSADFTTNSYSVKTNGPKDDGGPCTKSGYIRDPKNCERFYLCVPNDPMGGSHKGFHYFTFNCAPGTVFSNAMQTCAFPSQVPECSSKA